MPKRKPVKRHRRRRKSQMYGMTQVIGDTSKAIVGLGVLSITATTVASLLKKK